MNEILHKLKLRWKLLALVLPLVIVPIFVVAGVIGFIANHQAYLGITHSSMDDLEHMASFTLDLLGSHDQQFNDYRGGKPGDLTSELSSNSFTALKKRIKAKKVGASGYIYCMSRTGTLTIHPDSEGMTIINAKDSSGKFFIREMCEKKNGWIRYPWKNPGDNSPRMKIVRYTYFPQWDWIVAVGSYEDEFYHEANKIKEHILLSMLLLIFVVGTLAVLLVFRASTLITSPITHMIEVIRRVKRGNLEEKMAVQGEDELAEMAGSFNRMTDIIRHTMEMEASLAQQGKMASLGVLSSGVAHEINNPLGVILGYAAYLEGKMSPEDPNYTYIHEIKRESKRCKKIVQDLLSYARTPRPSREALDLNALLHQIVDFAANHTDMRGVVITTVFAPDLPAVMLDGDQLRQVAINLILNAGGAMPEGGTLEVKTGIEDPHHVHILFQDNGCGIPPENIEKIFEPFYTTKDRGTGLGLAITRQIIEQHQGEIRIESVTGMGTTVKVVLPVNCEEL